MTGVVTRRYQ